MTAVSSFESIRFWGWIITDVAIIAFLAVVGLSLVFGLGINGLYALPAVSWALIGIAIGFVGGLTFEIYGSVRIWLSKRRTAPKTPR